MRLSRVIIIALCLTTLSIVGIVLYFFNPSESAWMPHCVTYMLTGYKCPSCGGLRATHNLLHLNFKEALAYNPMLPVLLIVGGIVIYRYAFVKNANQRTNIIWVAIYLTIYCGWWVIRNILGL